MKKLRIVIFLIFLAIATNQSTIKALAEEKVLAIQIIIDASGSMNGEKLLATKSAITETIEVLPSNVFLRLISIRSTPKILVDYTQDKTLVEDAILNIEAKGDTSLFDAISLAINSNSRFKSNRIVVLSDGKDTASRSELKNLVVNLVQENIPVDIVALQVSEEDQKAMKNITSASNGLFFSTSNLSELKSTYLSIFQTAVASPTASPSISTTEENTTFSSNSLERFIQTYQRLIAIILSILIFVAIYTFSRILIVKKRVRSQRERRKESINYYFKVSSKSQQFYLSKHKLLSTLQFPRYFERHITNIVESRHLKVDKSIVRILILCLYLIEIFVIFFLFQNILASFVLASAILPIQVSKFADISLSAQKNRFAADLPNLLTMASGGLKSGLSIEQTFDAYSIQNESELAIQLRRTLREVQMGEPLESSLNNLAARMSNSDLEWIVTALTIQKTVGGSLADIIDTVLETIRSRIDIRREVRTLSAEGRLSALVLVFLPISIFLFLVLTQKEYMAIYWTTPLGVLVLIFVGILMTIGWIWMKKLVEIRV